MMKRIKLMLIFLLISYAAFSQNEQEIINSIKSDVNYLYATGVSKVSAEEASDNAQDLLAMEIEQWLKENSTDDASGYIAKSKEKISQIRTQRGSLYRVFVYVSKKDVLPYYKEEKTLIVEFEEPKEQKDLLSQTIAETDAAFNSTTTSEGNESSFISPEEEGVHTLTDFEKKMLQIQSFSAVNDFIKIGKESGVITNAGKYANMPQQGLLYIFIYNKQGEVPACLKKQDAKSINLTTGMSDLVTNYKGCGAIWLKIKEE